MKKNMFKVVLATVAMLAAAPVFAENDNDNLINNDTMNEGRLITRETSQLVNGQSVLLTRFEMKYVGNSDLLSERREYTWNAQEKKWEFSKVYNYAYDSGSYTITMTLASGKQYVETYFR